MFSSNPPIVNPPVWSRSLRHLPTIEVYEAPILGPAPIPSFLLLNLCSETKNKSNIHFKAIQQLQNLIPRVNFYGQKNRQIPPFLRNYTSLTQGFVVAETFELRGTLARESAVLIASGPNTLSGRVQEDGESKAEPPVGGGGRQGLGNNQKTSRRSTSRQKR